MKHFDSQKINIGSICIGGAKPVMLQSMCNTSTSDIQASVDQSIRIIEAGGQLVRITTPTLKDVEMLAKIKDSVRKLGYETPFAADVHFNPRVAFEAAKHVEKVRINPGNFTPPALIQDLVKQSKEEISLYDAGKLAIEQELGTLIDICKKHNTALRIGTNHGSLSQRIMDRYGDTPEGMVEATMEYLRVCVKQDFHAVVISLKSSNTRVMVHSKRLLVQAMQNENMAFPLHLGVTEAGEGEDGRIKSALGIGSLLLDGIGDTIRVSLTEDPEQEIPVAALLASFFPKPGINNVNIPYIPEELMDSFHKKIVGDAFEKRISNETSGIGGTKMPVVIANYKGLEEDAEDEPEFFFLNHFDESCIRDILHKNIRIIYPLEEALKGFGKIETAFPLLSYEQYITEEIHFAKSHFVFIHPEEFFANNRPENIRKIKDDPELIFVLYSGLKSGNKDQRYFFHALNEYGIKTPVIIYKGYQHNNYQRFLVQASAETGSLFLDGLGDGLWLEEHLPSNLICRSALGILQAGRARFSKTEYISCPGCGRTLFDLQEATAKVKANTKGLSNLKIAIMGCIVNGPGEMADADYGYVGAGPGKVSIYKNKVPVFKNIPEDEAIEKLLQLIHEDQENKQ